MRTTSLDSFIVVKTVNTLLVLLLVPIAATQEQAPPILSATNDAASAATNAAATNITLTTTNDAAARRQALQQSFSNRLSRMGTNQLILPAPPTLAPSTNAVPVTTTARPINPALGQATNPQALAGNPAPAPAA